MDPLTPPPSFENTIPGSSLPARELVDKGGSKKDDGGDSAFDANLKDTRTKTSPSPKKLRALVGGNLGNSNVHLSHTVQHPLRSRENSPEHFMQQQPPSRQPVRVSTPIREVATPPPSVSTFVTSAGDALTPPTTVLSESPHTAWSSHYGQESEYGYNSVITVPSPPSTALSYEVLSGYESVSPAEKVIQHRREMMLEQERSRRQGLYELGLSERVDSRFNGGSLSPFRPNAELGFPISEGLRRYYPNSPLHHEFDGSKNLKQQQLHHQQQQQQQIQQQQQQQMQLQLQMQQEASAEVEGMRQPRPTEFFERFNTFASNAKERFGGSPKGAYQRQQAMEEEPIPEEYLDEAEREQQLRDAISHAEQSQLSLGTSGIPSYSKEFDPQRWRYEQGSRRSISSAVPNCGPPGSFASINSSSMGKKDNIISAYIYEIVGQIDTFLRWTKKPICFLILVGGLGLLLSAFFSSIAAPLLCHSPGFSIMGPCQDYLISHGYAAQGNGTATYPDFPTLMNIESSFEKIVDGAAGGTALARAMKQSELAVSDLSTLVQYSELKCRVSLSEKLDVFARDAKKSVRALSGWGSKVGGVLDQLLSINQYSLRELNALKEEEKSIFSMILGPVNYILSPILYRPASIILSAFPSATSSSTSSTSSPVIVPRNSARTRAQIALTFNKAAEVLENNLRLLVADGETIFESLTHLTELHKPIYDEIVREVVDIKKEETAVLSSLWTKIGGNASQRRNFKDNTKLLGLIGKHEEEARGYVENTVLELDRMMADLENLRKRVAEPLLNGDAAVPGVGTGDIPLQVHIEAIEKAVERLVQKRGERRAREDAYLRKLVERQERGPKEDILFDNNALDDHE